MKQFLSSLRTSSADEDMDHILVMKKFNREQGTDRVIEKDGYYSINEAKEEDANDEKKPTTNVLGKKTIRFGVILALKRYNYYCIALL